MEYLYFVAVLFIVVYWLFDFKKKPNTSTRNFYYNSKFYRVAILIAFVIIAAIISFLVKKNK